MKYFRRNKSTHTLSRVNTQVFSTEYSTVHTLLGPFLQSFNISTQARVILSTNSIVTSSTPSQEGSNSQHDLGSFHYTHTQSPSDRECVWEGEGEGSHIQEPRSRGHFSRDFSGVLPRKRSEHFADFMQKHTRQRIRRSICGETCRHAVFTCFIHCLA